MIANTGNNLVINVSNENIKNHEPNSGRAHFFDSNA